MEYWLLGCVRDIKRGSESNMVNIRGFLSDFKGGRGWNSEKVGESNVSECLSSS